MYIYDVFSFFLQFHVYLNKIKILNFNFFTLINKQTCLSTLLIKISKRKNTIICKINKLKVFFHKLMHLTSSLIFKMMFLTLHKILQVLLTV